MVSPFTVPSNVTSSLPSTAPNLILLPTTLPLTVPLLTHFAETETVPEKLEPSTWNVTWNDPDVEANFALRHVPLHGPATCAGGGEPLGEGCAVGVGDGARVGEAVGWAVGVADADAVGVADADADAAGVAGSVEGVPLGIVTVGAGVLVASGVGDKGANVNELAVGVGKGALQEQAERVSAVNARTMILTQIRTVPPSIRVVGRRRRSGQHRATRAAHCHASRSGHGQSGPRPHRAWASPRMATCCSCRAARPRR